MSDLANLLYSTCQFIVLTRRSVLFSTPGGQAGNMGDATIENLRARLESQISACQGVAAELRALLEIDEPGKLVKQSGHVGNAIKRVIKTCGLLGLNDEAMELGEQGVATAAMTLVHLSPSVTVVWQLSTAPTALPPPFIVKRMIVSVKRRAQSTVMVRPETLTVGLVLTANSRMDCVCVQSAPPVLMHTLSAKVTVHACSRPRLCYIQCDSLPVGSKRSC
jgi:hypothetical protein